MVMKFYLNDDSDNNSTNNNELFDNQWKELFVNSNDGSNEGLIHTINHFFQFNFIQKQEQVQLILHFYLIYF